MSDICYKVESIGESNYRPHVDVDGRVRGIAHCPVSTKVGDLIVIEPNNVRPCKYRFKRSQSFDLRREKGICENNLLYLTHFAGNLSKTSVVVGINPNQLIQPAYSVIVQLLLSPKFYAKGREKTNARSLPLLGEFGSLELRVGKFKICRWEQELLSSLMAEYEGKNRAEVLFFDSEKTRGPILTTVEQECAVLVAAEKKFMGGFL
jgi:hypothetical protein